MTQNKNITINNDRSRDSAPPIYVEKEWKYDVIKIWKKLQSAVEWA